MEDALKDIFSSVIDFRTLIWIYVCCIRALSQ